MGHVPCEVEGQDGAGDGDEGRELKGIEEAPPLGLQPDEGEEQKRVEDQVGRERQEGKGKVGDEMPSSPLVAGMQRN